MSNKFNKLSVFLSSTFATSSILGISIGIPLYLNSKNTQNVDSFNNSNKIKNNESNQIIFNNNVLNKLNNDIIGYINSNKLSYLDFEECLMDESKLNEFKSNLVKWSNDLLTLESIGDINLTQNNNNIKLNISSKLEYKFICENNSQYFDSSNSCLVFSNLDLYKELSFNNKNISDFKSKLQEQINTNRYTNNEFKSYVESSEFIDFVVQNLKLLSGTISQDNIGNISFDINKNELSIQS
ncbi:MAG: hypothetical protein K2I49_00445, partial [Ureaplasma sp.]|nr:hypothetical protein [Ureaplasma sp.]